MVGKGKRQRERARGPKGTGGGWIFLREGVRRKRLAGEKSDRVARNFEMDSTLPPYPGTLLVFLPSTPFLFVLFSSFLLFSLCTSVPPTWWGGSASFLPRCSPRTRGVWDDLE